MMSLSIPLGQDQFAVVDQNYSGQIESYQWFLSKTGYAVGFVPGSDGRFQLVYMHRFIVNASADQLVDHINGNPLDNRRENLRLVTPQQNGQNKRLSTLSCTGLKGVGWHKRRHKFHARIQLQGVRYHLGFFDDPETAAMAYDEAARRLFGAFALCNYPEKETPRLVAILVAERLQRRGLKLD